MSDAATAKAKSKKKINKKTDSKSNTPVASSESKPNSIEYSKRYKCPVCSRIFAYFGHFKKHMAAQHGQEDVEHLEEKKPKTKVTCDICKAQISDKRNLL